jgi:hypothetical protein
MAGEPEARRPAQTYTVDAATSRKELRQDMMQLILPSFSPYNAENQGIFTAFRARRGAKAIGDLQ